MVFIDISILIFSVNASLLLRLGEGYSIDSNVITLSFLSPMIGLLVFLFFGLYREIVRFIGINSIWLFFRSSTLHTLFFSMALLLYGLEEFPRSVVLINWLLVFFSLLISRTLIKVLSGFDFFDARNSSPVENIALYGAGTAGAALASSLMHGNHFKNLLFIDDDKNIQGRYIQGIRVVSFDKFKKIKEKYKIQEVLLSMPSITRKRRNAIIENLSDLNISVKTIPSLRQLSESKISSEMIQNLSLDDLLDRNVLDPDIKLLEQNVYNKSVMVTGAGGSIGSELCRQIVKLKPKKLIMFDHSEYALYQISQEIGEKDFVVNVIGTILSPDQISNAIRRYEVQTIYHAAAYKHVPMIEKNILSGVENNVIGTFNCAQSAINNGVNSFILISTDKAVRPTNYMGATKRFAEIIIQSIASEFENRTLFTIVRFGNVIGSSGSVIPLFYKQIDRGGPVTVTHKDITRYFMTISEAAELVIQSGAISRGGDIFVLNMGEPVKILNLAKKMIKLSGYGNIEIQYTGLRPGEKLYEELMIGKNFEVTQNANILRIGDKTKTNFNTVQRLIMKLKKAIPTEDFKTVTSVIETIVPEFKHQDNKLS